MQPLDELVAPRRWQVGDSETLAVRTGPVSSRLDTVAAGAFAVSMPRQAVLGLLLGATLPSVRHGCSALRPLWADEAMQRAIDTVRLVTLLERRAPVCGADHDAATVERRIAGELAAAYRALDRADDAELLPCSPLLRRTVRGLMELFGPLAGSVRLRTTIERLSLPAFQRRALTLTASRLVVSALSSDAIGCRPLCLNVSLLQPKRGAARLLVADNVSDPRRPADEIIDHLAGLLEGDPAHHANFDGGIVTELTFPV